IGTAGHCAVETSRVATGHDESIEQAWGPGAGPEAQDADRKRIGEGGDGVVSFPKDFSLIRLDPTVQAMPDMAYFGGPTGINDDDAADPVTLEYYGQGTGLGLTVPARTAAARNTLDPDRVDAYGVAGPGDSGSGVISAD